MRIVYGHSNIDPPLHDVTMTVGTFDGVHLGHRTIVKEVVRRAHARGGAAVVYSFYPPPWRILGRTENPFLITTFRDKATLMAEMGVDVLVTETFSSGFQRLDACSFVHEVLIRSFDPKEVLVGYDFRFGKKRMGNLQLLQDELAPAAIASQVDAVKVEGEVVSSTRIRKAVVEGDLDTATRLLGRRHFISGAVVRGDGRGRTIGYPTANISPKTELIPAPGVYAVVLETPDGETHPGVANLGFRPTFAGKSFSIEAHLFDFEGDLYGLQTRLHFVARVRGERRFESRDALVNQIQRDEQKVRGMLPFD